jgi:hypothetical protein
MARIAGCILTSRKSNKEKLSEIEKMIEYSQANVLLLPEEYFGGPSKLGAFESFSTESRLFYDLSEIAKRNSCGLVVGLIEQDRGKKYQAMWFFDEKGTHVGTERKHNLARYERHNYGLDAVEGYDKHVYCIRDTMGTSIFCWEVHDIKSREACDNVTPDWVLDAIKFPPGCLTAYTGDSGDKTIKELVESKETYEVWLERLKILASDLITLVIATCGTHFSLCSVPEGAKPIAAIVHPDRNVSSRRFEFGPIQKVQTKAEGMTWIDRAVLGTIACTEIPGTYVSFDYQNDIELLRGGIRQYEAKCGKGSYPMELAVSVRSWQLRHMGSVQE